MDSSVVAVDVPAVSPGVAAAPTAAVATAVAAAAPASTGAAARREEPVSKSGDAGCVGRAAVGVGDRGDNGLSVGDPSGGRRGGAVADGAAEGCINVLHGESSKRLAPPRNTKDRKHLQDTQSTVNRHTSQTKHQAQLKGQAGRRITPINTAAMHASAQQPTISTHTRQGHHQLFSADAARLYCSWPSQRAG